jgi:hypothetical protein
MLESEEKVLQALETGEPDNLIRLSTGVVLKGKCAPIGTLIMVLSHFKRPEPPIYHNKTMGRDMENPDDPDYLARVQAFQIEQADGVLNAMILLGTELASKPKGMPGPDSDKWLDEFSLLELPMKPENERWRYLTWVKTLACPDANDSKLIQEVVGRLSGVSKSDVRAAEEFPGS